MKALGYLVIREMDENGPWWIYALIDEGPKGGSLVMFDESTPVGPTIFPDRKSAQRAIKRTRMWDLANERNPKETDAPYMKIVPVYSP